MPAFTSLIIGPGAIGTLVCAELQPFSRVLVHPHRQSLVLPTHLERPEETLPLSWGLPTARDSSVDVIWVCCKATTAKQATQQALSRYPSAAVVLLHNGMGPQQALSRQFGRQIFWGSTTCGALPEKHRHFRQTSFGQTLIDSHAAEWCPDYFAELYARSSQKNLLNPRSTDDIEGVLWQKILVNACINPLTAYYGVKNGQLAEKRYHEEINAIICDVLTVMAANKRPLPEKPASLVNTVIKNSADNWSSMARDQHRKQPTEIDFINGFLIDEGRRLGVETPSLVKWYKRIAQQQKS